MRTEITQQNIDIAANEFEAYGAKATARAVLQKLGMGSLTTILSFLQKWKNKQVKEPYKSVALPAGLNKAIVDFLEFQRFDAGKPQREKN